MRGRYLLGALLCLSPGCFSGDDFSDCIAAGQCGIGADGRGLICISGRCEAPPAVPAEGDFVLLEGNKGDLHPRTPEGTVVIGDVEVLNKNLRVEAEVIIVDGTIDGNGRGFEGGEGGRGGPVGAPGDVGSQGAPARPDVPGGGVGGEAGPVGGGDGETGGGGVYQADDPCRIDFSFILSGSGGGGGGGGGGGDCRGTPGGQGGGGGAAIMLKASRYIEVRGAIGARGVAGLAAEDGICGGSGVGGPGGGGSGGLIYLHAPTVIFSDGAALDVSGAGEGSGGLVTIFGTVEGRYVEPVGVDDSRVCRSPLLGR